MYLGIDCDNSFVVVVAAADDDDVYVPSPAATIPPAVAILYDDSFIEMTESDPLIEMTKSDTHGKNKKNKAKKKKIAPFNEDELSFAGGVESSEKESSKDKESGSSKEEIDDNDSVDADDNLGEMYLALEAKKKASAEEEKFEDELRALQVNLSKGKQRL